MEPERDVKSLGTFTGELDEIDNLISQLARAVADNKPEMALVAHQAEWHVKGMVYHLRDLLAHYQEFASEVSARAATGANLLVMYAPSYQKLMFEFYALVNLARISLDNLRLFLSPVFVTPFGGLPKSISDYTKDSTDCPVYQRLAEQTVVGYLSDIRNCIVHFRTFATSDNAVVTEEGVDVPTPNGASEWTRPMAKASYRRVGENGVSVNILLPDTIFVRDNSGDKRMAQFTYRERYNILSQSMAFVQLVAGSIGEALSLLLEPGKTDLLIPKAEEGEGKLKQQTCLLT